VSYAYISYIVCSKSESRIERVFVFLFVASVSYAYISYIVVGVILLCLLLLLIILFCICGCEACGCAGACAKRGKKKKDNEDDEDEPEGSSPVRYRISGNVAEPVTPQYLLRLLLRVVKFFFIKMLQKAFKFEVKFIIIRYLVGTDTDTYHYPN
jgi:hypothetical protein